jgi:hypothetical protein
VRRADVLVENFRTGVLDRLRLGVDTLHELNPRLVVLSITGFGHDGPEGGRAGYDQIAQGEAGLMSLTGSGPDDPQKVAFQMPLYPMIDDRGTASSRDNATPVWNTTTDNAAWDLYLGHLRGGDEPAYAAPARAADLAGLPPTLTFVGDIEPFHDEVVDWCQRLQSAGVPVRVAIYPGAFHGFDVIAKNAPISLEARAFFIDG